MPATLLTMHGVQKRFGSTLALRSVDLQLEQGQVLALIGENGAGKSTLMKVLSGAHKPDAGEMTLGGQHYSPHSPLHARRSGVAMIYQELSIVPHLTVMENILLGVEPGAGPMLNWSQMKREAQRALGEIGRSDIPANAIAGDLGIAEQQLIEIARAVALGSRVLVLDEPTSSLTRRDIANLFAMLKRLKSQGIGIIYISHFLEEVREISDRFTVLRDGASVGSGNTADVSDAEIIRLMVGRSVDDLYPRTHHTPGEVVLELDHLAGLKRPINASLALRRGEVLGIGGLIGAGRTELLRSIFGLDPVRQGRIKVGVYTGPASPSRRWDQGMGMISEDRKTEGLALGLSIADNITLSELNNLGPMGLVLPSRQKQASMPWIKKLGIKCRTPGQPVSDLSGGNQQKVAIARLLHHNVDLLLCDEPTRGVDIGAKAQIYRLIDELALAGKAVLMVSSYLPELMGVCDRIAMMNRGTLGPAKPVDQCNEHSLMADAIATN